MELVPGHDFEYGHVDHVPGRVVFVRGRGRQQVGPHTLHRKVACADRPHQADRHVLTRRPIVDIGFIGYGSGDDFRVGCHHALGHRAPHASQGLGAAGLRHALCDPFDIGPRDGAAGPGGRDALKIDIELAGE